MDGPCYVINALSYNAKFTKMCTVDCTRNNQILNYDSGTENTVFFIKNSTEKKQLMFYFLSVLFLIQIMILILKCVRKTSRVITYLISISIVRQIIPGILQIKKSKLRALHHENFKTFEIIPFIFHTTIVAPTQVDGGAALKGYRAVI